MEDVTPDPRLQEYFEEWIAEPGINQRGISLGRYTRLRMEGRWNDYADKHLRGRFRVEGES